MEYIKYTSHAEDIHFFLKDTYKDCIWLYGDDSMKGQPVKRSHISRLFERLKGLDRSNMPNHKDEDVLIIYHLAPISFTFMSLFDENIYLAYVEAVKKTIQTFIEEMFYDSNGEKLHNPNVCCFFEDVDNQGCPCLRTSTVIFNGFDTPSGPASIDKQSYYYDPDKTEGLYMNNLRATFENVGYETRTIMGYYFEEKRADISNIEEVFEKMKGTHPDYRERYVYALS